MLETAKEQSRIANDLRDRYAELERAAETVLSGKPPCRPMTHHQEVHNAVCGLCRLRSALAKVRGQ